MIIKDAREREKILNWVVTLDTTVAESSKQHTLLDSQKSMVVKSMVVKARWRVVAGRVKWRGRSGLCQISV